MQKNEGTHSSNFAIALIKENPAWVLSFSLMVISTCYWLGFASERYVSEARVMVQSTDLSIMPAADFTTLVSGSISNQDNMILRDYLLSVDMLEKLEKKLMLRKHFSEKKYDLLSRMWMVDAPTELFHRYYLNKISIEPDDITGVLVIKSQAFSPLEAYNIAEMLLDEGEQFMNELAHRLARNQVGFLEQQVDKLADNLNEKRNQLLLFQNSHGLISPEVSAAGVGALVTRMESQLADLQTQKTAMEGYLNPEANDLAQLNLQVNALEKQLTNERSKLATGEGKALNTTLDEFNRLRMEVDFALDLYKSALSGLEKGRIETIRTLKMVSIVQQPTMPEYSLEPRRIYKSVEFILTILVLTGIYHLISAIVRDHKD